ncbi:MAG: class I SAM-dependent methyltransferase, partial [Halobacteriaceae archaeon]
KQILELAAGTGRFTVMLAERGADVTGMDISAPMLHRGLEKAERANITDKLHLFRGDAARLPFPDDHFDAVFAMRFFHLADTPATFLSEMARVSQDQVFFDTFNAISLRSVYNWLLPMGSRLYSQAQIRRLLGDTGLHLNSAEHDFVLPYGLYRKLPDVFASPLRASDAKLSETTLGKRLATVSYWNASV